MTTLLFLPAGTLGLRWCRIDQGAVRWGEGVPPDAGEAPVIVVPPADAVALHWAELPSRSPAQAIAAARLLVAEASATPIAELHVAVGDEGEGEGEGSAERPIAVVANAVIAQWLVDCAAIGIDPQHIIPAPLLLPRPDEGYVRATIAGVGVARSRTTGFADEAPLADMVIGDTVQETLSAATVEAALIAAAEAPVLDLRQGLFARRRRRIGIDWALVRRLALLGAAILLVTLGIDLVRIAKYSFGADALEARTEALGRTGLARGETVTDVDRQLAERLSAVRGPGLGFSTTVAAIYAAVRATPGTELTALDFQSNGSVRIGVGAAREALPTDLKRALEAAGFTVTAGTFQSANGRVTGEMTVSRP